MGPGCSKYEFGQGNGLEFWGHGFSPAVFSASRSCFMDKLALEPSFDYLKSWIKVYHNKRKMFLFRTCMAHNFYGETSHQLDELLQDFLMDAIGFDGSKNPNMVIRIYSDHGDHQNKYNFTPSGDFEKHFPIMLNILPKSVLAHNPGVESTFKDNTKRLTTPVDFFWTDLGLIGGKINDQGNPSEYGWFVKKVRQERSNLKMGFEEFKNLGNDLLSEEVDKNRMCQDIPFHPDYQKPLLGILDHCHCKH